VKFLKFVFAALALCGAAFGQSSTVGSNLVFGTPISPSQATGGSGVANTQTVTQSNSFTANQIVGVNLSGVYVLAEANAGGVTSGLGVVTSSTGAAFTFTTDGLVTGLSGITPGAQYYLSDSVAGAVTTTPPTNTSSFIVGIYQGISSTTAQVTISPLPAVLTLIPLASLNGGSTAGLISTTTGGVMSALNGSTSMTVLGPLLGSSWSNSATLFLAASGAWVSGGSGTVTAVSIATANGFSGSSSGGATPSLTIVAGAITPTSEVIANASTAGNASYTWGALPSGVSTSGPAYNNPGATYTVTGTNTATYFQAIYFGPSTFTDASAGTVTDLFTENIIGPPLASGSLIASRVHSVGILDSTSSISAVTGALVIASTYGATGSSVGIGAGNINAGNGIIAGGVISTSGGYLTLVVGKTLGVKSGANGKASTFTLASGIATVSNTSITANSVVHAFIKTVSGTITGSLYYPTVTVGTGFTVAEVGGVTDNSTYNYWIEENN
jgi:hypothetical protein